MRESDEVRERDARRDEKIRHLESIGAIVRECAGCDMFYVDPDAFGPRHKAKDNCESGKHAHCSCSVCF